MLVEVQGLTRYTQATQTKQVFLHSWDVAPEDQEQSRSTLIPVFSLQSFLLCILLCILSCASMVIKVYLSSEAADGVNLVANFSLLLG